MTTMSNYDPGQSNQSDASPEDTQSSKRRRIALACLDCRRRKLKCDRNFPACSRCQKSGNAASCIYDPDAVEAIAISASAERIRTNGTFMSGHGDAENGSASKTGTSPSSFVHHHALDTDESAVAGLRAHIYRLENRVIGLEKITNDPQQRHGTLAGSRAGLSQTRAHFPEKPVPEDSEKELMLFRGKNFKTQFYGVSHHTSYLSCLPELRNFMKDMVSQHPGLAQTQLEIKAEKVKDHQLEVTDKAGKGLLEHLPSKKDADVLLEMYIDHFESTYRVLHLPSFFEEYQHIWDKPNEARAAFVALLLAMLAATSCLKPQSPTLLRGDSSLEREQAISWLLLSKSWLQLQSNKHVNLTTIQIHCVIFIAEQVNAIKRKRTWTSAGILSRMAMAAGLHRDAEILNIRHGSLANRRVSLFDQEMRRRIWTTIVELELQASIERGMPAMLRDFVIDCGAPLNIDDTELNPKMDRPRVSKPISTYTRSSFLYISHSSFPLRQELVSQVNGIQYEMPYEEILHYDRQINLALDEIPAWPGDDSRLSRSLLQIQLHQLLLLIHRPYVHHDSDSTRYDYSAVVHLRAALSILELHQKLCSAGIQVLSIMRNDMLSAVLGICYSFSISNPTADGKLSRRSKTVGFADPEPYLENGLTMVGNKIAQHGVGIQEYYCICSVIGLHKKMSSSKAPSPTEEYQAADCVVKMLQKMLSRQDNFSAAATLASLPNMHANSMNGLNGGSGQSGNGNSVPPPPSIDNAGILEEFDRGFGDFDLTSMSVWDLDAFFNI